MEYIDESSPPSTSLEIRQSNQQSSPATTQEEGELKKLKSTDEQRDPSDHNSEVNSNPEITSTSTRKLEVKDLINTSTSNMSDGSKRSSKAKAGSRANKESENEARALRVLEIMNDFRTLQVHITSLVTRPEAEAPDAASRYLDGYALLRQCNAEAQAILATQYNPGSLGIEPGRVPDTEVQKATLQRYVFGKNSCLSHH